MANEKGGGGAWKWVLGIGCGCLVLVVGGFALLGGAAYWGMNKVFDMEPMLDARAEAAANPTVTAALGTPLELGWGFTSGNEPNVNMSDSVGEDAVLSAYGIQLSGPDGSARMNVESSQSGSTWTHTLMEVELDGETIDLLTDGFDPVR